jgi:mono/diheme cytochrome c family protein/rhodanese-related sulfurtransferase
MAIIGLLLLSGSAFAEPPFELSKEEASAAAADYQKYCALCHGKDRQGYANDEAPSLRSKSLMRSGFPMNITFAIAYGRHGTPMGGYFEEVGGPMDRDELYRLTRWLSEQVDVEPIDLPLDPVVGDAEAGALLFADQCAVCHGENGEGAVGPAIGNPAMLALTTDAFLRYAIENGRDGTDMPAFGPILSPEEIDALTAFLRSRATGWEIEKPVMRTPPAPDEYVLNPEGAAPEFTLKDSRYVKSADLHQAIQDKRRMVLLDTRVTSMWQMAHIEGSVPMPYYYDDVSVLAKDLPQDGTWIISYCECPRAAAESVDRKLRDMGFDNTAVLWEGIQGWVSLGYPVSVGQSTVAPKLALPLPADRGSASAEP